MTIPLPFARNSLPGFLRSSSWQQASILTNEMKREGLLVAQDSRTFSLEYSYAKNAKQNSGGRIAESNLEWKKKEELQKT